ncbi:cytochrome P450 6k1-like [Oppia nitens]|uniref:cytochrome P450 6k1-like n=1 Tax=Oppia nitens TaxID=1686743 RepID=UPI0023DC4506|nr:cytochrome P450 6k1-like [Oppia nitens]
MIFSALFGWNSLIIFGTVLIALYFYLTRNFNYWSSRGISGPKPIPVMGGSYQVFHKTIPELGWDNYQKYGKIYGTYMADRPVLVVGDPKLIKNIFVKDFHLFVDRNDWITYDPINDRSLLNLKGDDWKKMRSIISPTFSSGKMRSMHPLIIDCIKRLDRYMSDKHEVEMKKAMGGLTMDVIATCAFGTRIDAYINSSSSSSSNSSDQKPSDFVLNAQKVFRGNWRLYVVLTVMAISTKLLKWSGIKFLEPGAERFFVSVIQSIVDKRMAAAAADGLTNQKHNDYIQLMINAKNKTIDNYSNDSHQVVGDDKTEEIYGSTDSLKYSRPKDDITDEDLLATSMLFFVAGYETTATTLSTLMHSLAVNQDCQQKLYEEVTKQFDGKYDYESIGQMPYLEACVAETLRIYSPITSLSRHPVEDYIIDDISLTIPKGMPVMINVSALHRNPEYYPEPDRWNPERFMPYNRDKLVPYTYMPFGLGPRNCVGMRFALMETKTAIAYLITKYKFVKTPKTTESLKSKKYEFLFTTDDIYVGVENRN